MSKNGVEGSAGRPARDKRPLYILLPPLALLLGLGLLRLLPGAPGPERTERVAPTAAVAEEVGAAVTEPAPSTGAGRVIGPATPWAVNTPDAPAAEPPPSPGTLPPGDIALHGPPAGSEFGPADAVAFYWSGPGELAEDRQFVLYLADGAGQTRAGAVDEANFGGGYRLTVVPGDLGLAPGPYAWFVRLETKATAEALAQSESRTLSLSAD